MTIVSNAVRQPDQYIPPTGNRLRFLKLLRAIQTLSGIVPVLLIPLLWGAWSQTTLLSILGTMFVSVSIFTLLSWLLHSHFMRGEL